MGARDLPICLHVTPPPCPGHLALPHPYHQPHPSTTCWERPGWWSIPYSHPLAQGLCTCFSSALLPRLPTGWSLLLATPQNLGMDSPPCVSTNLNWAPYSVALDNYSRSVGPHAPRPSDHLRRKRRSAAVPSLCVQPCPRSPHGLQPSTAGWPCLWLLSRVFYLPGSPSFLSRSHSLWLTIPFYRPLLCFLSPHSPLFS